MNSILKKFSEEMAAKTRAELEKSDAKEIVDQIKAANDSGSFRIVVSSEHEDRQGEIVLQDGIDTGNYMLNPVVLNSHEYHGIDNIVGITDRLTKEVIDGVKSTVAEGRFAPTESGKIARQLWEEKFLNAGSIGFIALGFDANNPAVINKSEMLEWSLCAVPANPRAVRLASIGLTVEGLRAKGFEIAEEEKASGGGSDEQEGDACTMGDGGEGTLQTDSEGRLVCVPKAIKEETAAEEKGAVADELNAEEMYEQKCQNLDPIFDIFNAFYCVYMDEATPVEDFPTLLAEMITLLQNPPADNDNAQGRIALASRDDSDKKSKVFNGLMSKMFAQNTADTKDVQQIGAILAQLQNVVDNAIIQASKLILDIAQSDFGQSVAGKEEIAKAVQSSEHLKAIKLKIADVEHTLGIGEREEHLEVDAAKERSKAGEVVDAIKGLQINDLDDFIVVRSVLRAVATVAQGSLERINKKIDQKKSGTE